MLQQTRVDTVKGYYARFLASCPDIRALAEAPEDVYMKLWEGLGYYSRVRNMHKAAEEIMTAYGGEMPGSYEKLLGITGIRTIYRGGHRLHRLRGESTGGRWKPPARIRPAQRVSGKYQDGEGTKGGCRILPSLDAGGRTHHAGYDVSRKTSRDRATVADGYRGG